MQKKIGEKGPFRFDEKMVRFPRKVLVNCLRNIF